jgi:hypothetical protein
MERFKNIFLVIEPHTRINFSQLIKVRRAILEKDGLDTSRINWELYARILEEKHKIIKAE